jgi:hypothetical protein
MAAYRPASAAHDGNGEARQGEPIAKGGEQTRASSRSLLRSSNASPPKPNLVAGAGVDRSVGR